MTNRCDLYLDELRVGDSFRSKTHTFTENEIVEFARLYDPQPFHLDPAAAALTSFNGLIASGFQTLAISFRLVYQTGFLVNASLGGPALEEVLWKKPVRPDDTVYAVGDVRKITISRSKPDRGVLNLGLTLLNQNNEPAVSTVLIWIVKRARLEKLTEKSSAYADGSS
jgi:acyl dehydratase